MKLKITEIKNVFIIKNVMFELSIFLMELKQERGHLEDPVPVGLDRTLHQVYCKDPFINKSLSNIFPTENF